MDEARPPVLVTSTGVGYPHGASPHYGAQPVLLTASSQACCLSVLLTGLSQAWCLLVILTGLSQAWCLSVILTGLSGGVKQSMSV